MLEKSAEIVEEQISFSVRLYSYFLPQFFFAFGAGALIFLLASALQSIWGEGVYTLRHSSSCFNDFHCFHYFHSLKGETF